MIESRLEFSHQSLRAVVEALFALTPSIRPTHWSVAEDDEARPIENDLAKMEKIAARKSGFFLRNNAVMYDISLAGTKSIVCSADFDEPSQAQEFVESMCIAEPSFGFACKAAERCRRNRVNVTVGVNKIESWVGRDSEKYVPGLYWLTLLPERLATKHGISIDALVRAADEHILLGSCRHLFRFYRDPAEWMSPNAVDDLYMTMSGLFDVGDVERELAKAKTYREVSTVLHTWN